MFQFAGNGWSFWPQPLLRDAELNHAFFFGNRSAGEEEFWSGRVVSVGDDRVVEIVKGRAFLKS